ncbi:MAG: SoxR reducing system RseC family protein [Candidatus Ratteibacteria bacterium]|nr:SoxR reducing system RseC family protein [Candidatus Ratteibacteria bacterium]
MLETGIVAKIEDGKAIVSLAAGAYCDKCRICLFDDKGQRTLRANNDIGAKIGDRVEVFIPDGMISKSSFLIFILPIITFLIGYSFAWFFSRSDVLSVISGAITFVLTFYALFIYEKKINQIKKDTLPYISKILKDNQDI